MVNMMFGEVAPGGTGSGLYGMLILAVITVFVAGLMIGRTPEYLKKKIGRREIKFASLYLLTTPLVVLVGHRHRDGVTRGTGEHAQPGRARAVRGALRVHLGGEQQRVGVRRADRQHRLVQHRARAGHAVRPAPPDDLRAGVGRVAGQTAAGAGHRGHPAHPPAAVRRHVDRRRRSSSSRSPTSRRSRWGRWPKDCTHEHHHVAAHPAPATDRARPRAGSGGSAPGCSTRRCCGRRCRPRCASWTRARCGATR